jgi:hypothetical protein
MGEGEMPECLAELAGQINEGLREVARALNLKADMGELEYFGGKSEIQIFNETDHALMPGASFGHGRGAAGQTVYPEPAGAEVKWFAVTAPRYFGGADVNAFNVAHELAHALPGHAAYVRGMESSYFAKPRPFDNAANRYAGELNAYRYRQ